MSQQEMYQWHYSRYNSFMNFHILYKKYGVYQGVNSIFKNYKKINMSYKKKWTTRRGTAFTILFGIQQHISLWRWDGVHQQISIHCHEPSISWLQLPILTDTHKPYYGYTTTLESALIPCSLVSKLWARYLQRIQVLIVLCLAKSSIPCLDIVSQ